MAKGPARKLKVFQAQIGFYDTVVAVPSQAAALRAWGTHQNLFDSGEARLATDEAAIQAALAHPDEPLRRALGSNDAFALKSTSLPKVPDAPKALAAPTTKQRLARPERLRAPADRSKLDAAEAALREVDEGRKAQEAALEREAEALERKRSSAQDAYVDARKSATAAVVAARTAYREAGGVD